MDVSGRPLEGVLWARTSMFRPDGTTVLASERVPYPIVGGAVSADLAPGPAVLTVDCGPNAYPIHVDIPAAGPVTLADLIGDSS